MITDEDRDLWRQMCEKHGWALRPFLKLGRYIREVGRQGWMVECSKCGEDFRLFEWSFYGKGKKCPGCDHHFGPGDLYTKAGARKILWGVEE